MSHNGSLTSVKNHNNKESNQNPRIIRHKVDMEERKYTRGEDGMNNGMDPDFEPGTGRKCDASCFCCASDCYDGQLGFSLEN